MIVRPNEEPAARHDGSITMGHEEFSNKHVTLHVGQELFMRNTSKWLHVLVLGENAKMMKQMEMPSFGVDGAHVSQTGDVWTFGPFEHTGTYHITCQLHPEMNLTVVVTA